MKISQNTSVCISVASRPSNFGTTVHNAAFRALGLNFIYKGFGIDDIEGAIKGVRALGIRGCSVSMPFKQTVIPLLDDLDETAGKIGAVNTILNESGKLCGYNTDVHGARMALMELKINTQSRILILGSGGVACSIVFALQNLGVTNVTVANRTQKKAGVLISGTGFKSVDWDLRDRYEADVLINATSIGMQPDISSMPISENALAHFDKFMDVVVSPVNSRLITEANLRSKIVVRGDIMCLHQAAKQFEIYTENEAPLEVMKDSIKKLLDT